MSLVLSWKIPINDSKNYAVLLNPKPIDILKQLIPNIMSSNVSTINSIV